MALDYEVMELFEKDPLPRRRVFPVSTPETK
jgi:hypothetical protein